MCQSWVYSVGVDVGGADRGDLRIEGILVDHIKAEQYSCSRDDTRGDNAAVLEGRDGGTGVLDAVAVKA